MFMFLMLGFHVDIKAVWKNIRIKL